MLSETDPLNLERYLPGLNWMKSTWLLLVNAAGSPNTGLKLILIQWFTNHGVDGYSRSPVQLTLGGDE